MAFEFEKLETSEGRMKFERMMEKMELDHLNVVPHLSRKDHYSTLSKLLLRKTHCFVRIYLIDGFDLAQRDVGSHSDPYIKIKFGKKVIDERKSYQLDEPNPKFHRHYDFDATFPGSPSIKL